MNGLKALSGKQFARVYLTLDPNEPRQESIISESIEKRVDKRES